MLVDLTPSNITELSKLFPMYKNKKKKCSNKKKKKVTKKK